MPAITYERAALDISDAPAGYAIAVTPHDTNELTYVTRGIYVGGSGNITLVTQDGNTVVITGAQVGTILPIRARIIKNTGTTATNLVALS